MTRLILLYPFILAEFICRLRDNWFGLLLLILLFVSNRGIHLYAHSVDPLKFCGARV